MTDLSFPYEELKELDLSSSESNPHADNTRQNQAVDEAAVPAMAQTVGFDYSGASPEVVAEAEATVERIRNRHRASIIDTGADLLAIKAKLAHGKFGNWLTYHFGMSERTAQNYMNSATAFGSAPKVVDVLPPSTVYKLAATGTPEEIRLFVIESVASGGALGPKEIETRIAKARSDERQKREEERAAKHEEQAWQKHEKTMRSSGNTEEEIERERKLWATKKAGKERLAKQKTSDAKQREEAAKNAEEKMKEIAERAAKVLKKRLGNDYETFRDIILRIDYAQLKTALLSV